MQSAGNNKVSASLQSEVDIFDQIINQSRSMITIINRDYVYERVNDTFCRELGVKREEIVGKSLSDIWGEENFRNQIKGKIDSCFAGETIRYEACFDTHGLGIRYYEVAFRPVTAINTEVNHIVAETFDIHELRISRQEAIEKEEELRKMETNIPIGILRCFPDGRIMNVNTSFLRILGFPEDTDIEDLNMKEIYPAWMLFNIHVEQLIRERSLSLGRVFLRNFSGDNIPCRISGFLAADEGGTPVYIDFAVEDASRELMLENRLIQAQKLQTIGALAGGIAHDFNNILTTISGYSEMLHDDLPKDSLHYEKVSRIRGAVLKAQSIINQMLAFSRQIEQEKILVDPGEVLQETIGFMRSSVPADISLKSHIEKCPQLVLADPTQLFRVFLNLMTNAVQAMEERGGTLSVHLEILDSKKLKHEFSRDIVADEYVLVTFRDTGKGMEPSVMQRIFEPFFTTREVGKGTGLGLSVIHGIVTEMEGEVLVSSSKGEGSVFFVYLPVAREFIESPVTGERKKIFFVTGNRHESRILSIALEKSNYELIYISDRKSMIETMGSNRSKPDLIILMGESLQVKPEDFVSVYEKFDLKTPCLLICDSNQDLIAEKLLNSGIVMQHLIKPVSLRELRNGIQMTLG